MSKNKPTITYSELINELDKYRPIRQCNRSFTKEQIAFLKKCREHKNPVTYPVMIELWEKMGWGRVEESTMRRYYNRIQIKGEGNGR